MQSTVMSLLSQAKEHEHKATVLHALSELIQWDTAEALLQYHKMVYENDLGREASIQSVTERLGELLQPMLGQHGFDVAIKRVTGKPLVTTIHAGAKKISYLSLTFLSIRDLPLMVFFNPVLRTIELSHKLDPMLEELEERSKWSESHNQPGETEKLREHLKHIELLKINLPPLIQELKALYITLSESSFCSFASENHDESEAHAE